MKKRSGKRIIVRGKKFNSIKEACKYFGVNYATTITRMNTRNFDITQAIFGINPIINGGLNNNYISGIDFYLYRFRFKRL